MSRRAAFVYDEELSRHVLGPYHPMKPVRLQQTYELLKAYEAFDGVSSQLVAPRPATEEEIGAFHLPEYIQAVKRFSSGEDMHDAARFNFSNAGDNPVYPGMYEAAALSVGASIVAAEMIESGRADVAFNISGGLHHAASGRPSGFCVFNDPVVAIKQLVKKKYRVAYVDIDAHHGDGVQNAFYDTDQVLTISLHESGMYLFPGTGSVQEMGVGSGAGYSVNLPLYPGTEDSAYIWAFREVALPLLDAFKPDVLATQLGIDAYHSDPLTHLRLSTVGFQQAVSDFGAMGIPWLAMGGGGYDLGAVARCWTLAYGVMVEREWSNDIPSSYAEKYGIGQLMDSADSVAAVPDRTRQEARAFAEKNVELLKQLVFPIHNVK